MALHIDQVHLETADRSVCRVYSSRLDDAADNGHTLHGFLNIYLIGMQIHIEFSLQGDAEHGDCPSHVFLLTPDDGHIIDKTYISATETPHDPQGYTVKNGKEEGTEQLRSDVSDRHSPVRWRVEAGLLWVELFPEVDAATFLAVSLRNMEERDLREP